MVLPYPSVFSNPDSHFHKISGEHSVRGQPLVLPSYWCSISPSETRELICISETSNNLSHSSRMSLRENKKAGKASLLYLWISHSMSAVLFSFPHPSFLQKELRTRIWGSALPATFIALFLFSPAPINLYRALNCDAVSFHGKNGPACMTLNPHSLFL